MAEKMSVEQAWALLDWLASGDAVTPPTGNLPGALATLRAEVEGLRADAERYRWLRAAEPMSASPSDMDKYVDEGLALDRAREVPREGE